MIKSDASIIKLSRNHLLNYEVHFIDGIFISSINSKLAEFCQDKKLLIAVDKNVFDLYGKQIEKYFRQIHCFYKFFLINASEQNKTMETVLEICQAAKDFQMKRDSIFIGIGGGITLDIVGFTACIFRRKTRYIRIPTTLVGLVDAGVGVKVGVNFNNSKNLLGGYYPPIATFNDQSFLKTLDIPDIRNGLYEIVKMALIGNKLLFELTENYHKKILTQKNDSGTGRIIFLSAVLMMKELEPNLHEPNLKRSVDFGHTFSPYIEEASGYTINHGEAVGLDVFISSYIALKRGIFSKKDFDRTYKLIRSIGFTSRYELPIPENLYKSLDLVRNHRAGNLNLVLPSKIGSYIFTDECSLGELKDAIAFYKENI